MTRRKYIVRWLQMWCHVASIGLASCRSESDPEVELLALDQARVVMDRVDNAPPMAEDDARLREALRAFRPLPQVMTSKKNPVTPERVLLGRKLFEDPRLSADGTISCTTCHPFDRYGVDGLPISRGPRGILGRRNVPTMYNAAQQKSQLWDGRVVDVETQAKEPFLGNRVMEMASPEAVIAVLVSIPEYRSLFAAAFPDAGEQATSFGNVALAIAAFERTLVTPSRWDRFLVGAWEVLSVQEKRGFSRFVDIGCATCHTGAFIGGDRHRLLGSRVPWPNLRDQGRFGVTGLAWDKYVFKVAMLRNVEKTAPYLHDGSIETLEEAVERMAYHQLEIRLEPSDVADIVAWLRSLTGEIPRDLRKSAIVKQLEP